VQDKWCSHPWQQSPVGLKMNILNEKKLFFALRKFQDIEPIKRKLKKKIVVFVKFVISVMCGCCYCSDC